MKRLELFFFNIFLIKKISYMDSNKRENGESILTKKKAAFKFTKYL